jgi:hypothetical protein
MASNVLWHSHNSKTWNRSCSRQEAYECVSKSFRTGLLERELQMVQLFTTRCSCTYILWVSLVSFTAINLCVAAFVIDSVWKLLDTPSYCCIIWLVNSRLYDTTGKINLTWHPHKNGVSQTGHCSIYLTVRKYHFRCSVIMVTKLWDERSGFDSRQLVGFFLLVTSSRPALEPTQPPIQWVPGALSLGIKRPGLEADH